MGPGFCGSPGGETGCHEHTGDPPPEPRCGETDSHALALATPRSIEWGGGRTESRVAAARMPPPPKAAGGHGCPASHRGHYPRRPPSGRAAPHRGEFYEPLREQQPGPGGRRTAPMRGGRISGDHPAGLTEPPTQRRRFSTGPHSTRPPAAVIRPQTTLPRRVAAAKRASWTSPRSPLRGWRRGSRRRAWRGGRVPPRGGVVISMAVAGAT